LTVKLTGVAVSAKTEASRCKSLVNETAFSNYIHGSGVWFLLCAAIGNHCKDRISTFCLFTFIFNGITKLRRKLNDESSKINSSNSNVIVVPNEYFGMG